MDQTRGYWEGQGKNTQRGKIKGKWIQREQRKSPQNISLEYMKCLRAFQAAPEAVTIAPPAGVVPARGRERDIGIHHSPFRSQQAQDGTGRTQVHDQEQDTWRQKGKQGRKAQHSYLSLRSCPAPGGVEFCFWLRGHWLGMLSLPRGGCACGECGPGPDHPVPSHSCCSSSCWDLPCKQADYLLWVFFFPSHLLPDPRFFQHNRKDIRHLSDLHFFPVSRVFFLLIFHRRNK